jgi:Sulfotransferase family
MTTDAMNGSAYAAASAAHRGGDATRGAPVIVLTYPHGGAARLRALLDRHAELAWTSGTGILPLCEQAATAWRAADGRDGQAGGALPPLAATSVRALLTSLITSLLVREGKRRWCEIAAAPPAAAETFLRLYPGSRVVCLHRACPQVGYAALHASPWGLSGPGFAPFTATYPASTAAALAAYWAAHTGPLLAFEQAHPGQCYRLRYEDLADGPPTGLLDFLGLDSASLSAPAWAEGDAGDPAAASSPAPGMPAEQFPARLLTEVNDMMRRLGYPAVRTGT